MKSIKAFIKGHPLVSYFVLTFTITWGGFVLAVGGLGGFPATPEQFTTLPLGVILATLVGPSVSGIALTGLVCGRAGLRELGSRLLKWRASARWYAVALLTAPLVFAAVLFPLSFISPVFLPGIFASEAKVSFVLMGIVVALIVGIFEELGWTGFAVPTLLRLRYSVLSTGIIVGVLWGSWHLIGNDIWASVATSGGLSLALFVILRGLDLVVGQLLAYRVLMVWVYERTNGSLLLAMLMHASFAACTFILGPLAGPGAMSGVSLLTYDLALAVVLWVVVGAVALANHGHLTRQPPRRRRAA